MKMNIAKKRYQKTKKAFTLVELSLAIAFISLLLIIMTTLILSLIAIYRKGITINAVNSVGRSIIEDIQNSVSSAQQSQNPEVICRIKYDNDETPGSPYQMCVGDHAKGFVYQDIRDNANERPKYGAFCTGSYSYIWNTGYALKENSTFTFTYNGTPNSDFRLLKVLDSNREVCQRFLKNTEYGTEEINGINWGAGPEDSVVDLIAKSDTDLALYYLYVAAPATNKESSNAFYAGSFILATLKGGVNIMSAGNYCKPPGEMDAEEDFNYCAINKFNFAVQGNGG